MPIGKPGKVLLREVPLKFVAKKVSGHGRKSTNTDIPLIPLTELARSSAFSFRERSTESLSRT